MEGRAVNVAGEDVTQHHLKYPGCLAQDVFVPDRIVQQCPNSLGLEYPQQQRHLRQSGNLAQRHLRKLHQRKAEVWHKGLRHLGNLK